MVFDQPVMSTSPRLTPSELNVRASPEMLYPSTYKRIKRISLFLPGFAIFCHLLCIGCKDADLQEVCRHFRGKLLPRDDLADLVIPALRFVPGYRDQDFVLVDFCQAAPPNIVRSPAR